MVKKHKVWLHSDIKTDAITAAGWAAAIAALLGVPVSSSAVKAIAKTAVAAALPTIYYKVESYYINPVTASRPKTAHYYTFYKNKNNNEKIGSYDFRYKL